MALSDKINREIDNQIALSSDLASRSTAWKSRPTALEFSYNNLCNLKCVMCAKSDNEPNWVLDTDTGTHFLDEVLPHVIDWTPSANSEPMLNDIDLIARKAEEHQVWLHVISNGTLLTPERYAKVRRQLHKLWISLDAATKETFEKIRVPAKWDRVMSNVRQVLPLAQKDAVEITFNFVLMSDNWQEAGDFVRLVADLGGRVCNIQELLPNSTQYQRLRWEDKVSRDQIIAVLDDAKRVAAERSVDLKLELHPPLQGHFGNNPDGQRQKAPLADLRVLFGAAINRAHPGFCSMATSYLKVTPDGGVYPCCRGPAELKMGDIRTQSFEEIWNGKKYQRFRQRMFDRDYPQVCTTCYVLVGNPNYQRMKSSEGVKKANA